MLITIGTQPQSKWFVGFIGSATFALFTAVVAMAIPTKRKIIFVPVSLLIAIVLALIIGILKNT
jgi:hypothetical protein